MAKRKPVDCKDCEYNEPKTNGCSDKEYFVDKFNSKLIICRYYPNAIPFKEHKDYKK